MTVLLLNSREDGDKREQGCCVHEVINLDHMRYTRDTQSRRSIRNNTQRKFQAPSPPLIYKRLCFLSAIVAN